MMNKNSLIALGLVLLLALSACAQNSQEAKDTTVKSEKFSTEQEGFLLKTDELNNYLDSPAGWRTDAMEVVGDQFVNIDPYACCYKVSDVKQTDQMQIAFNASQFGPVLIQQLRLVGNENAMGLIADVHDALKNCEQGEPLVDRKHETTSYTFSLEDSSEIPNSVMWKRTTNSTDPNAEYVTNVAHGALMVKGDVLVCFIWGITPATADLADPKILLEAMKRVAQK